MSVVLKSTGNQFVSLDQNAATTSESANKRNLQDPLKNENDNHKPSSDSKPGRGRRLKDLSMFARQLAVLVRTGTPLAQAMDAIQKAISPGAWFNVIEDLRHKVDEGSALSDAMLQHKDYFDPVCSSLMAAGEASGELDSMLSRLSDLTRQQLRIRRSIGGALVYPALLMTIGVIVVIVMIGFVLPQFAGLFETLDAPLPPSTQVLMAISGFIRDKWWMLLIILVIFGGSVKYLLSTKKGSRALDTALVKLPYVGTFLRNLITARIARLLGVLLGSQVRLLEALQLTKQATTNACYNDLLQEAEDAVSQGEPLSLTLARSFLINPSLSEAIKHGEQSGQLGVVLLDMAEFMDEENDNVVKTLASILEPVILIILGVVVGCIAVSMFLPLFDLTSLTQGG